MIEPDVAAAVGLVVGHKAKISLGNGRDAGKVALSPAKPEEKDTQTVRRYNSSHAKSLTIGVSMARLGVPREFNARTTSVEYDAKDGRLIITLPCLSNQPVRRARAD